MPETITHIEDEVRSDPGEENRFSKEKKADTKAKDKEQNKKEQGTKGSKEKKLSFRDAKEITRVGFNLLEGHNLVVSKDELRYFGELLKKHGHNPGEVDRMVAQGDPKILEIAFNILREAHVEEAKERDWRYTKGTENRKQEEESIGKLMQDVKNTDPKKLSLPQISQLVKVDEFEKFDIEAKGGPGAAEAGGGVYLRQLLQAGFRPRDPLPSGTGVRRPGGGRRGKAHPDRRAALDISQAALQADRPGADHRSAGPDV